MNKYGENTVLFVTIQSWCIYVIHEKNREYSVKSETACNNKRLEV